MTTPNPYTVQRLRLAASEQVGEALDCLNRGDLDGALVWYRDAIRTCRMAVLDSEADRLLDTYADIAGAARVRRGLLETI